jgi:hypothetical protein
MDGFVRRASEGDARWFYGNLFIIKAAGPDTGGRFSLIEATSARYLLINSPPGFADEVAQAPPSQTLTLPPPGT